MKRFWLQRAYWLTLGLASFQAVFATTFANRPLGEVVNEAQFIFRGKTGTSYTDWGKGQNQQAIFTYTEFEVSEVLKGGDGAPKAGEKVVLRQPGGSKDGVEMSVAATASFAPGEDVVVLVAPKDPSDSGYDVLNFTAGKYNVVEENGQTFLVNSLGGGEVYDPNAGKAAKGASYNSRISLDIFKQVIRGEARDEAQKTQFSPTVSPSAQAHGHTHATPSVMPTTPAASPAVDAVEEVQPSEKHSLWVPISFAVIFVLGSLGLWMIVRGKGGDS